MTKISSKQIDRIFTGPVKILSLSVNGSTVNATSLITSSLTVAGYNGGAVPLVNSSNETTEGLIITAGVNRISVFLTSTGKPIYYLGEKVYGRLTYSAGIYTISLFYLAAGVETAYSTGSPTNLDFIIFYRFSLKNLPSDTGIITYQAYPYVEFNDSTNQGRVIEEKLNVTAPNTISSLTYTPTTGTKVTLYVNGKAEVNVGGTPPFTVSGNVITWNATNAEYTCETTFTVMARYQTLS